VEQGQYRIRGDSREVYSNCMQAKLLYRMLVRDFRIIKLLIKMILILFLCCLLHT